MLKTIFNPDNTFFRMCGKLADILMLSVLWFICCIPIVTIASASGALYNSTVKCLIKGENSPYKKFFDFLKENFKQGIPVSLLIAAIFGIYIFEMGFLWDGAVQGMRMSFMFLIFGCVFAVIPIGFIGWIIAIFSRYEFTFPQLAITSFKFVFAHLLGSVVITIVLAASLYLSIKFAFPIVVMPCLSAVISSFFIEKAFKKHQ